MDARFWAGRGCISLPCGNPAIDGGGYILECPARWRTVGLRTGTSIAQARRGMGGEDERASLHNLPAPADLHRGSAYIDNG